MVGIKVIEDRFIFVGDTEFDLEEFEYVYVKLTRSFKFPEWDLTKNEKTDVITSQLDCLNEDELKSICLYSIVAEDFVDIVSDPNKETENVDKWVNKKLSRLETAVGVVLSVLWMKRQPIECYDDEFYKMFKMTSSYFDQLRFVKFTYVLDIMDVAARYYRPNKCTGKTQYISYAIINSKRYDITGKQDQVIDEMKWRLQDEK